jgi:hypothetical protein
LRLIRIFAIFALLDGLILADFICDSSAAGTYGTTDESSFAAACKRANNGSARRGSANDLGACMVSVVFRGLLPLRTFVGFLTRFLREG